MHACMQCQTAERSRQELRHRCHNDTMHSLHVLYRYVTPSFHYRNIGLAFDSAYAAHMQGSMCRLLQVNVVWSSLEKEWFLGSKIWSCASRAIAADYRCVAKFRLISMGCMPFVKSPCVKTACLMSRFSKACGETDLVKHEPGFKLVKCEADLVNRENDVVKRKADLVKLRPVLN